MSRRRCHVGRGACGDEDVGCASLHPRYACRAQSGKAKAESDKSFSLLWQTLLVGRPTFSKLAFLSILVAFCMTVICGERRRAMVCEKLSIVGFNWALRRAAVTPLPFVPQALVSTLAR